MSPDSPKKKFRIGEILVNHGYITEEELQQALAHQKGTTQTEDPSKQGFRDLGVRDLGNTASPDSLQPKPLQPKTLSLTRSPQIELHY